jgi:hypothetical protein
MTRADVISYRDAFGAFLDCAASDASAQVCAESWTRSATPLLDVGADAPSQARNSARYYVDAVLRGTPPAGCL